MSVAEAPIKVSNVTRQRARLAAALLHCTQGEVVDRAVAEYIENNSGSLKKRLELASEALEGGDEAVLAFMTGLSAEEIARVS